MKKKKRLVLLERKIYKYRKYRIKRLYRRYRTLKPLCKSSSLKMFLPFSINNFYKRVGESRLSSFHKISVPEVFSFYHNFNDSIAFLEI